MTVEMVRHGLSFDIEERENSIIKKDKDRLFNNQGETIHFLNHDGEKP